MDDKEIGLAKAISMVRAELAEAIRDGTGEAVKFAAGAFEVEFSVVVTKDAEASGGVRLGVVSLGGKGSLSDAETHRVKFTFWPVDAEGQNIKFADLAKG